MEQPLESTPVKRTRICVSQSKKGCFTCKARKVKCGEERPACNRCTRSGRKCEGYPSRAFRGNADTDLKPQTHDQSAYDTSSASTPTSKSTSAFSSPSPGSDQLLQLSPPNEQNRLARIGCSSLSREADGVLLPSSNLLGILLPQLSHAVPTVNAAAAALGAVLEFRRTPSQELNQRESAAAHRYVTAIRGLHRDLDTQPHGTVPLLFVCALLASSELLLRRQNIALLHLHGAYQLLQRHNDMLADVGSTKTNVTQIQNHQDEDEITRLFRTIDLQVATYAPAHGPMFAVRYIPRSRPSIFDVPSARNHLIPLLHACYTFRSQAEIHKYIPWAASPEMLVEKGRWLGQLSAWLDAFNFDVMSGISERADGGISSTLAEASVLRMTCLSAITSVSVALEPYQCSYDRLALHFQQIVTDGTKVVAYRQTRPPSATSVNDNLTIVPGIIEPLFITAIKYRHSAWRQQAVDLMAVAGMEGPWTGRREAIAAARLIELEESGVSGQPQNIGHPNRPSEIVERARIHGANINIEAYDRFEDKITVIFSRCRDIEAMVAASMAEGAPRPWDDEKNWELWDETLSY